MKIILLMIGFLLPVSRISAYNYGEHKEIGDQAFIRFITDLQQGHHPLLAYLDFKKEDQGAYRLGGFPARNTTISYGVLNALSGDHESNPLLLEEQLRDRKSVIYKVIALHNQYIQAGYSAAPDGKLAKLDIRYALLAASNLAHFYEYNKTMEQQLRHFNKAAVLQSELPDRIGVVFKKLDRTNAVNMYVTLHVAAMDLAEQSGRLAREGNSIQARKYLYYAVLFNAFADHFLEDAFAAGHLVVNRSVFASFTNNKALHDFYCEHGCVVANGRGEIWKAYGDGQFNSTHHAWQSLQHLDVIQYAPYTQEAERVITAVAGSLHDIAHAFSTAYSSADYIPFIHKIPEQKEVQALFLLQTISVLQQMPIPFHVTKAMPGGYYSDSELRDSIAFRKATQPLVHRNFVRSRVANSLVLSTIGPFRDNDYRGLEVRINAGNFSRKFVYNNRGGKKGMMDYWHGYTLSFSWVRLNRDAEQSSRTDARYLKLGIRSNYDYWVSDRKFVGLFSYVEAGLQFRDHQTRFIFVPTAGLQLASLFNLNYYNMPVWLRLPLQYILPLKLRWGAVMCPGDHPRYFSGVDLDLLF